MKSRHPTTMMYAATCLLAVAPFTLVTCTTPTDPTEIGLRVIAPASVLVHEHSMLIARAVNDLGVEITLPEPMVWTSNDSTVVSVASTGVVRGLRRGNAVITVRAAALSAEVVLRVNARVRVVTNFLVPSQSSPVALAVGDSVQFLAEYLDVFGAPIDETPAPTWTSSNPAGVTVSSSGLAVGLQAWSNAAIIGTTPDGLDSAQVRVSDAIAGLLATIRFANAVRGTGPVTFFPSKGAPVTLSFGESVERPIQSGLFHGRIEGADGNPYQLPSTIIRTGDRLELYAINGWEAVQSFPGYVMGNGVWVVSAWGAVGVPPDSARVRFIQSSPFLTVYTQPPNAPAGANPISCYFDPSDLTDYRSLAVGDFDFIMKYKGFLTPEIARIRATAPGGRAVTYVVLGETAETAGLLAFPDPLR